MSVTSPAKSQVIAIEKVPRQYNYAALAFMQIAAGGSAGNVDCSWLSLSSTPSTLLLGLVAAITWEAHNVSSYNHKRVKF